MLELEEEQGTFFNFFSDDYYITKYCELHNGQTIQIRRSVH